MLVELGCLVSGGLLKCCFICRLFGDLDLVGGFFFSLARHEVWSFAILLIGGLFGLYVITHLTLVSFDLGCFLNSSAQLMFLVFSNVELSTSN